MNRKVTSATAFTSLLLLLALVGVQFIYLAAANPIPITSFKMSEEYIDYTISHINGSYWATVDGTYYLYRFDVGCQDPVFLVNYTGFVFVGDTVQMVYPTPPGTTNISVKMNETELNWSNYTQNHPEATHHTAIGDWPMIDCTINHVPDYFILKIHYEHPIILMNGRYTFLYDLNISPYLSPWCTESTAHFKIQMETNYTNLQVNTVGSNDALNPLNYTITRYNTAETITLQILSEYAKPLPGDLILSFTKPKTPESTNPSFLGTTLPKEYGYAIVAITAIAIAAIAGYLFLKRKKQSTIQLNL